MRAPLVRGPWYTLGDLVLLALAAWFASRVAFTLLLPPLPPPAGAGALEEGVRPAPAGEAAPAAGREGAAQAIVSRNLFGSRSGEPSGAGEGEGAPSQGIPLPFQLLGTVLDSGGGRSFAIFEDSEARKQVLVFVGESPRPGAVLSAVERNRAVFLRDGREEAIERTRERGASPAGAPPPPGRAVAPPRIEGAPAGDLPINVRQTGANSYVVDRRELDAAVGNFSQLATQVRMVPNFSDGKPDGFRLFNIRPNSLFSRLGLANGDIIRRVNGLEISGAEQAMQAFVQLREAANINLDLTRANRNLTLNFEVR